MSDAPARTTVVVVGVEQYLGSGFGALDGPAVDARRFADWFLAQGVPQERITVLVSPLPRNESLWRASGYRVLPADRAAVQQVFLRENAGVDGDLLWVVWGGHGVVDLQGHRRLFYADSTPDDRTNLDLDSLLSRFRTDVVGRQPFRKQVWVVDACQVLFDGRRSRSALPQETLAVGLPDSRVSQQVLFAARLGAPAFNLNLKQTGLFSHELLRLLSEGGHGWPPDVSGLAGELRRRMAVEPGSESALGQAPTYLWTRDAAGDENVVGGVRLPASTAESDGPWRIDQLEEVVQAALAIGELVDPQTRSEVVALLDIDVRGLLGRLATDRLEVIRLIRVCGRFPDGLRQLVRAVQFSIGPNVPEVVALDLAVGRLA